MANWCNNSVYFKGDPEQIEKIRGLFYQFAADAENNVFKYPDFIKAENCLMADISINEDNISYRTRWYPNLQVLQNIADHFGVGFTNRYAEDQMMLWGQAFYEPGKAEDIRLDKDDFGQCSYDQQTESYLFEGISYEDRSIVCIKLLGRKIASLRPGHQQMQGI